MGKFLFLVKWLNSAKLTTTLRMEEGMSMTPEVSQYWQHFIEQQQLPPDLQPAEIYSFGNTEQMANELARLVIIGQKTATTSAIELYEPDEHVPQVGDYNVILDGRDRPVAITKTIMCTIVKYNQVDAEHAFLEGEGDRTLAYWRSVHEPFFKAEYAEAGQVFTPTIACLCERFEVVPERRELR